MPIVGRFGNTSGRPYVEGRLILPRLGLRSDLSFLLDTGADGVFITPGDALRMNVDYSVLVPSPTTSVGVGGEARTFLEPGILVFSDGTDLCVYEITIAIGELDPSLLDVPSLLGRSVLNDWLITYRPSTGLLLAEAESASLRIPIPDDFPPIAPGSLQE